MSEQLILYTVRLALLLYGSALTLRLWSNPHDWQRFSLRLRLARWLWTAGCLVYLAHVAAAFHFAHHWSHAEAVRHTEKIAGFGAGIYVNHLFTLLWSADLLAWWLAPAWYTHRSPWLDGLLHGFMLFVVFNATVVFAGASGRWAGAVLFVWLALVAPWRRLRKASGG